MFNALTRWCRRQPCIYTQQKKYQMEVSPFFHVQEQLNRLPTFQSQYQNHHSPTKSTQRKYQERRRSDMQEQLLKRVKSEPDCEIRQSRPNDKENIHFSYAHNHNSKPPPFVHRSHERPAIRILYETNEKTTQVRSPRMAPNTTVSTNPTPVPTQTTTIVDSRASSEERAGRDGSRSGDMVPLEEFNRMVNINLKLIKLIEDDYRPIRTSVTHLEQQHYQRRRMIEALEERVHRIREELIAEH